jgi:hypothetical protein
MGSLSFYRGWPIEHYRPHNLRLAQAHWTKTGSMESPASVGPSFSRAELKLLETLLSELGVRQLLRMISGNAGLVLCKVGSPN